MLVAITIAIPTIVIVISHLISKRPKDLLLDLLIIAIIPIIISTFITMRSPSCPPDPKKPKDLLLEAMEPSSIHRNYPHQHPIITKQSTTTIVITTDPT